MEVKKMVLESNARHDLLMGIDLGTTNSAVAIYTTGSVPVLCPMGPNGKTTLQSCVRWDGGDKFTVGPEAYAERFKPNVCYSVKRIMGSGETITFTRDNGDKLTMTPAQISAEILKGIRRKVDECYEGLYKCIITVPAYFNQRQIEDTLEAARLAGLECVQILKEPTSASYIYSNLGYAKNGSVLVYDLGGGTFDITVMSFLKKSDIPKKVISVLKKLYSIDVEASNQSDSSLYYCRVLGTYGDTMLGGDDIDRALAHIVVGDSGNPPLSDDQFEELVLRCEQFKKSGLEARDLVVGPNKYLVRRPQLREAVYTVFDKTMKILDQVPEYQLEDVKTIVLVGGSTKSAELLEFLQARFPGKEISRVLDPDATVALGAGAVAKDLQEGKVTPFQDVLPMAIGVLDNESMIDICIPKNTAVPYSMSRTYHTIYDNQEAVSIYVFQGVSKRPEECTCLGLLRIDKLPPRPAGELSVVVSFTLSAQGRLQVTSEIDGISEVRYLVVNSIFQVNKAEDKLKKFDFIDDFEEVVSESLEEHPELFEMLMTRRGLLQSGDLKAAGSIEYEILEVL